MDITSPVYRVMIVDDEPIQRTGLVHLCNWQEHGIDIVAQASNGQEALQLIEQTQPHVVITDIVMPVMDGVELTKTIRMLHPEVKVVVLSSYSEFDYVREVFKYGVTDYLLKPKVTAAELVSLIIAQCEGMDIDESHRQTNIQEPSLQLAQLLYQEESSVEAWRNADELFQYETYRVLKANNELLLSKTKLTQQNIEEKLLHLAKEHLANMNYIPIFHKNECLFIINYDADADKAFHQSSRQFADAVKHSLTYIRFIQSNSFHSLPKILETNHRIDLCLGKLIYFENQSIVNERTIKLEANKTTFELAPFIDCIRMLSIEKAADQLKSFFEQVKKNQDYDEYSLKRLCQNIIYSTNSALEHLNLPIGSQGVSRLKLFKEIDHSFDVAELEHTVMRYLDDLNTFVHHNTDQQHSVILNQIYSYVNENYASDITLGAIADELHLNYSYLSSYYKQRTNENLTTFINRVRIEKAKELLLDPKLTISEISRRTGFSEHNYFSKVFKKMTGLTPVEYRNQVYST